MYVCMYVCMYVLYDRNRHMSGRCWKPKCIPTLSSPAQGGCVWGLDSSFVYIHEGPSELVKSFACLVLCINTLNCLFLVTR